MKRFWLAAALASGLFASACTSTVQLSSQQSVQGADEQVLAADGGSTGTGDTAAGVADGATEGVAASAQSGGRAGSSAGRTTSAGGGAARQAQGAASGRGFTKDTIYIGYLTWNEVSTAGSSIGYAVDYGDQESIANAIVADINAKGGIAGRKIVLSFYDYKTADILGDPERADQSACSKMTEDRPVFAVIAVTGILSEVLPECLAKHQTPIVANTNIPYLKEAFTQWSPYFYSTASPMTERYIPVWLRRAAANGYFKGWDTTTGAPGAAPVKVGILSSEGPAGDAFTALVTQELRRQGQTVAAAYALTSPFDTSGINSAILRFRQEGVTHVVPDGLNLVLFPQSAESQQYRPRYVISTAQAPILIESAVGANQLEGTLGVGYFPSYDVSNPQDPGDPSPAATHCREIEKAAGNDVNQRESWNLMGKACDGFAFLAAAVAKGGLTPSGIKDGAAQLQSVPPAGAFAITFGPGRADGIAAVRDLGYDTGCSCFKFLNATNRPL